LWLTSYAVDVDTWQEPDVHDVHICTPILYERLRVEEEPLDLYKEAAPSFSMEEFLREVRRMLGECFKAIERRDLKNFLAFFAGGEDLTVSEDKEMYDWDGFVVLAKGIFQEIAEVKLDIERCTLNPLSPSVAVATGSFRGAGRTTSGEPVAIRNSFTLVVLKHGYRWRIKHVHQSAL
jgi:ketosteroid isomerase-like protein